MLITFGVLLVFWMAALLLIPRACSWVTDSGTGSKKDIDRNTRMLAFGTAGSRD
ncbi:unnamed protein product [Amoebophrya sp. A25]|nr:unnamed protein product [Amoebophrya sp. A25]|eukprot:GSA25T00024006001.1